MLGHRQGAYILEHHLPTQYTGRELISYDITSPHSIQAGSLYPRISPPHTVYRQGAYILGHRLPTHAVYRQGAYILGHRLPTQGGSLYPIGHHLPTQGGSLYPIGHHLPTQGGSLYTRAVGSKSEVVRPLHAQ